MARTRMSFPRGSLPVLGGRTAGMILRLIAVVLIARLLGPADRGTQALVFTLMNVVVTLVGLGLGSAIVVFVGKGLYSLSAIIGASSFLIIVSGALSIPLGYAVLRTAMPTASGSGYVIVLAPIAMLAILVSRRLLQGKGQLRLLALAEGADGLLFALALATMLVFDFGNLTTVLNAWVVSLIFSAVVLIRLSARGHSLRPRNDRLITWSMLRFGWRGYIEQIVGQLHLRIDLLLVGLLASRADTGRYSVAIPLAEIVWLVPSALSTALLGPMAAARRPDEAVRIFRRTTLLVLGSSVAVSVGIALLTPFLVPYIFGESYRGTATLVWVLLPGAVLFSSSFVANTYYTGFLGRPEISAKVIGAGVVVQGLGAAALLPIFGPVGAAAASSVAYGGCGLFHLRSMIRGDQVPRAL